MQLDPALPPRGKAACVRAADLLEGWARTCMEDPKTILLPEESWPDKLPQPQVWVENQEEWEEPVDSGGEGLEQSARLNRGEEPVDIVFVPHARATTVGFQSLDDVDLTQVFEVPAMVMKSIPKFMRGAFRGALKLSLQEIQRGSTANNSVVEARGWKLFFLLPRLLLFRPPRGGLIPKGRLQERLARFAAGDWEALLLSSLEASMQGVTASRRRRRRHVDDMASRVSRATGLANLGELSRARQALEGDALAPGDESTWKLLTDEVRRPRFPREPLRREFVDMTPSVAVDLDLDLFTKNLRSARRGVAGGPSGMTTEHLKLLLENVVCTEMFGEAATRLARGRVPPEIVSGIRLGRMTALQKPDGGVRGIVVGDVFRRPCRTHIGPTVQPPSRGRNTPHSSTPFPREQARSVWPTWCKRSPAWTTVPQFSL